MKINYDVRAKRVFLETAKKDGLETRVQLPECARVKLAYDFGPLPHIVRSISPVDNELASELKNVAAYTNADFSESIMGGIRKVYLKYDPRR